MTQKHFLKTTALALILSVTSLSPVSATKVTLQKHDWIGEDDSLIDIASKGATILKTEEMDGVLGAVPTKTQLVPYKEIAQVMEQDAQNVKAQVIASNTLTYPGKFEDYEQAFLRAVQKVLNKAPLNQIPVDKYSDLAKNLPPQAFKALRSLMTKSKDRNEWALDNTLGGYFTIAQNKNGKLALIIRDLNVVLPLFEDQRLAEMNSWIPSGVVPSKLQQDTASLFSLILLNQPQKLKKGVQYRLQNQQEPLGDAWYYLENGRKKPLELPLIVQIDAYAEKRKAFDKRYIEAYLLPILYDVYPADSYNTYEAFINYRGSGYKHGMNMYDYWQTWLNSKYGEKAKKHVLPKYELPIDLIKDKQTYDRQFIEKILLPTILEFYPYDPYKSYRDFIKPNNGSGYKVGMDINKYWDSWLNSRYRAAVEKRPLKVYQPPQV